MKVEPMTKEEIKDLIGERIRKRAILRRIADDDNLIDKITTDDIASLFNECITCYHCPLIDYCQTGANCHDIILTYLRKGVKYINEHNSEQL